MRWVTFHSPHTMYKHLELKWVFLYLRVRSRNK